MPSVCKNTTVIKIIEVIYFIDSFTAENNNGKSLRKNMFCVSLVPTPLDQIKKIKICHMVASEHPEVIEGRRRLIATDVIDYGEEAEDCSIDNYDADFDEEDKSGLVDVGVRTGVTQSGRGEVEEVQRVMKSSSLLSFMLKTHKYTVVFQLIEASCSS